MTTRRMTADEERAFEQGRDLDRLDRRIFRWTEMMRDAVSNAETAADAVIAIDDICGRMVPELRGVFGPDPIRARPGSKTYRVGELLLRPEGATRAEAKAATGWPQISMQDAARACGLVMTMQREGASCAISADRSGPPGPRRRFLGEAPAPGWRFILQSRRDLEEGEDHGPRQEMAGPLAFQEDGHAARRRCTSACNAAARSSLAATCCMRTVSSQPRIGRPCWIGLRADKLGFSVAFTLIVSAKFLLSRATRRCGLSVALENVA
jgi:hypothetical protein